MCQPFGSMLLAVLSALPLALGDASVRVAVLEHRVRYRRRSQSSWVCPFDCNFVFRGALKERKRTPPRFGGPCKKGDSWLWTISSPVGRKHPVQVGSDFVAFA